MAQRLPSLWINGTSNFQKLQQCLSCSVLKGIHSSSHLSYSEVDDGKNGVKASSEQPLPEAPTNCCMSGCANCVWIKYAEELSKTFEEGSALARQVMLDKVEDPNMRAFLEMELRTMAK